MTYKLIIRLGPRKTLMRKISQLKSASETAYKPATQADDKESDTSSHSESSTSNSDISAGSSANSKNSQKFKATLGDTTKLFSVKHPITLKKLRRQLAQSFPDSGRVRIGWVDEDGDKVVFPFSLLDLH